MGGAKFSFSKKSRVKPKCKRLAAPLRSAAKNDGAALKLALS
jgi:hypothetical protein